MATLTSRSQASRDGTYWDSSHDPVQHDHKLLTVTLAMLINRLDTVPKLALKEIRQREEKQKALEQDEEKKRRALRELMLEIKDLQASTAKCKAAAPQYRQANDTRRASATCSSARGEERGADSQQKCMTDCTKPKHTRSSSAAGSYAASLDNSAHVARHSASSVLGQKERPSSGKYIEKKHVHEQGMAAARRSSGKVAAGQKPLQRRAAKGPRKPSADTCDGPRAASESALDSEDSLLTAWRASSLNTSHEVEALLEVRMQPLDGAQLVHAAESNAALALHEPLHRVMGARKGDELSDEKMTAPSKKKANSSEGAKRRDNNGAKAAGQTGRQKGVAGADSGAEHHGRGLAQQAKKYDSERIRKFMQEKKARMFSEKRELELEQRRRREEVARVVDRYRALSQEGGRRFRERQQQEAAHTQATGTATTNGAKLTTREKASKSRRSRSQDARHSRGSSRLAAERSDDMGGIDAWQRTAEHRLSLSPRLLVMYQQRCAAAARDEQDMPQSPLQHTSSHTRPGRQDAGHSAAALDASLEQDITAGLTIGSWMQPNAAGLKRSVRPVGNVHVGAQQEEAAHQGSLAMNTVQGADPEHGRKKNGGQEEVKIRSVLESTRSDVARRSFAHAHDQDVASEATLRGRQHDRVPDAECDSSMDQGGHWSDAESSAYSEREEDGEAVLASQAQAPSFKQHMADDMQHARPGESAHGTLMKRCVEAAASRSFVRDRHARDNHAAGQVEFSYLQRSCFVERCSLESTPDVQAGECVGQSKAAAQRESTMSARIQAQERDAKTPSEQTHSEQLSQYLQQHLSVANEEGAKGQVLTVRSEAMGSCDSALTSNSHAEKPPADVLARVHDAASEANRPLGQVACQVVLRLDECCLHLGDRFETCLLADVASALQVVPRRLVVTRLEGANALVIILPDLQDLRGPQQLVAQLVCLSLDPESAARSCLVLSQVRECHVRTSAVHSHDAMSRKVGQIEAGASGCEQVVPNQTVPTVVGAGARGAQPFQTSNMKDQLFVGKNSQTDTLIHGTLRDVGNMQADATVPDVDTCARSCVDDAARAHSSVKLAAADDSEQELSEISANERYGVYFEGRGPAQITARFAAREGCSLEDRRDVSAHDGFAHDSREGLAEACAQPKEQAEYGILRRQRECKMHTDTRQMPCMKESCTVRKEDVQSCVLVKEGAAHTGAGNLNLGSAQKAHASEEVSRQMTLLERQDACASRYASSVVVVHAEDSSFASTDSNSTRSSSANLDSAQADVDNNTPEHRVRDQSGTANVMRMAADGHEHQQEDHMYGGLSPHKQKMQAVHVVANSPNDSDRPSDMGTGKSHIQASQASNSKQARAPASVQEGAEHSHGAPQLSGYFPALAKSVRSPPKQLRAFSPSLSPKLSPQAASPILAPSMNRGRESWSRSQSPSRFAVFPPCKMDRSGETPPSPSSPALSSGEFDTLMRDLTPRVRHDSLSHEALKVVRQSLRDADACCMQQLAVLQLREMAEEEKTQAELKRLEQARTSAKDEATLLRIAEHEKAVRTRLADDKRALENLRAALQKERSRQRARLAEHSRVLLNTRSQTAVLQDAAMHASLPEGFLSPSPHAMRAMQITHGAHEKLSGAKLDGKVQATPTDVVLGRWFGDESFVGARVSERGVMGTPSSMLASEDALSQSSMRFTPPRVRNASDIAGTPASMVVRSPVPPRISASSPTSTPTILSDSVFTAAESSSSAPVPAVEPGPMTFLEAFSPNLATDVRSPKCGAPLLLQQVASPSASSTEFSYMTSDACSPPASFKTEAHEAESYRLDTADSDCAVGQVSGDRAKGDVIDVTSCRDMLPCAGKDAICDTTAMSVDEEQCFDRYLHTNVEHQNIVGLKDGHVTTDWKKSRIVEVECANSASSGEMEVHESHHREQESWDVCSEENMMEDGDKCRTKASNQVWMHPSAGAEVNLGVVDAARHGSACETLDAGDAPEDADVANDSELFDHASANEYCGIDSKDADEDAEFDHNKSDSKDVYKDDTFASGSDRLDCASEGHDGHFNDALTDVNETRPTEVAVAAESEIRQVAKAAAHEATNTHATQPGNALSIAQGIWQTTTTTTTSQETQEGSSLHRVQSDDGLSASQGFDACPDDSAAKQHSASILADEGTKGTSFSLEKYAVPFLEPRANSQSQDVDGSAAEEQLHDDDEVDDSVTGKQLHDESDGNSHGSSCTANQAHEDSELLDASAAESQLDHTNILDDTVAHSHDEIKLHDSRKCDSLLFIDSDLCASTSDKEHHGGESHDDSLDNSKLRDENKMCEEKGDDHDSGPLDSVTDSRLEEAMDNVNVLHRFDDKTLGASLKNKLPRYAQLLDDYISQIVEETLDEALEHQLLRCSKPRSNSIRNGTCPGTSSLDSLRRPTREAARPPGAVAVDERGSCVRSGLDSLAHEPREGLLTMDNKNNISMTSHREDSCHGADASADVSDVDGSWTSLWPKQEADMFCKLAGRRDREREKPLACLDAALNRSRDGGALVNDDTTCSSPSSSARGVALPTTAHSVEVPILTTDATPASGGEVLADKRGLGIPVQFLAMHAPQDVAATLQAEWPLIRARSCSESTRDSLSEFDSDGVLVEDDDEIRNIREQAIAAHQVDAAADVDSCDASNHEGPAEELDAAYAVKYTYDLLTEISDEHLLALRPLCLREHFVTREKNRSKGRIVPESSLVYAKLVFDVINGELLVLKERATGVRQARHSLRAGTPSAYGARRPVEARGMCATQVRRHIVARIGELSSLGDSVSGCSCFWNRFCAVCISALPALPACASHVRFFRGFQFVT